MFRLLVKGARSVYAHWLDFLEHTDGPQGPDVDMIYHLAKIGYYDNPVGFDELRFDKCYCPQHSTKIYDPMDYGAVGDGTANDRHAYEAIMAEICHHELNSACTCLHDTKRDGSNGTPKRAALPPGQVSAEEMERFLCLRRKEIITEAREAFGQRATSLSDEEVLRIFFRELHEKSSPAFAQT